MDLALNCIKISHRKNTENCETLVYPVPETVCIPMLQHMGSPCKPLVSVGDEVKVGQKIGDSEAFMSVPVHSSVSGKVIAAEDFLSAAGRVCKSITIECDGKQTVSEDVKPPIITDKASLIKAVRESGCCGLGGAGFPTHIKLNFDENKTPIDSLVINAAECEPYITSDYREMMENPEDVLSGIKIIQNILQIENVYVCIESNKPKAIELLTDMTSDDNSIKIKRLSSLYPQGAEKVIAYNATGRTIKEGELPSNQGIIVMNVSTVAFLNRYFKTGMPLIRRRLTIDGNAVKSPCNADVPVGTSIGELLRFAECDEDKVKKVLTGGLMMGMCIYDLSTPVIKTNNAIIALKNDVKKTQTNCIRCGRCINACPAGLMPTELEKAYKQRDADRLKSLRVNLCMNCGSCSYVCPAKRNLAETNQLAKMFVSQSNQEKRNNI